VLNSNSIIIDEIETEGIYLYVEYIVMNKGFFEEEFIKRKDRENKQ
jgi:hypothetical protein